MHSAVPLATEDGSLLNGIHPQSNLVRMGCSRPDQIRVVEETLALGIEVAIGISLYAVSQHSK